MTNEQRSVKKLHHALLQFYGQSNRPTEAAIRAIVTKFRTKFTLLDIKPPTRLHRLQTEENIAAVSASVYGLLESWPKIHFFIEELCSATRLIFGSMGT